MIAAKRRKSATKRTSPPTRKTKAKATWWVYLARAKDKSIYTGVATDVKRRVAEHNAGAGSKALRGKRPVILVYSEKSRDRSAAQKREAEIKRWPRSEKLLLIRKSGRR